MWFIFQWFQFLTLLLFHFFFENINNNDQQSYTLPKKYCCVQKGGYKPLGGDSVEKWDNESGDKVLLIWNGWQIGTGETITAGPQLPWTCQH